MAEFLTAVSSKKINDAEPLIREEVKGLEIQDAVLIDSTNSALKALKNQPGRRTIDNVLKYLTTEGFSLLLPEPLNASIAHQLVNDTIPNYWRPLKNTSQEKLIAQILRNPVGLGHISTRLRTLITDGQHMKSPGETRNTTEHIEDLLDVLDRILHGDNTTETILQEVLAFCKNAVQQKLMWKEYLAQVASGRTLSIAAEAEDVLKKKEISRDGSWIADGKAFATWIGRNIASTIEANNGSEEHRLAVTELLSKVLGLGFTDLIVSSLILSLINNDRVTIFTDLISRMKSFEQRKYLGAIIAAVIKRYFISDVARKDGTPILASKTVSGTASLLYSVSKGSDILKEHLITSLTRSTIPLLDDSVAARRSVMASLAKDESALQTLLENSIKLFGDSVYMKYTPIFQQEVLAQNLALCCGYVNRSQPMFLTMMAKSTYHVNGMSNRIGTPSARARFLGIVVGVAISKLVDKPDLQLRFELEDSEAEEARWYQHLTQVEDKVGSMTDLPIQTTSMTIRESAQSNTKPVPKAPRVSAVTEVQGPRIVEVLSDSEDEDNDLVPYEKPDSDPEDDGDDPETIKRNKPTAPVYIRDLIATLRDQENYDRHELGLATAASLIRRKANFGTEVTDHLEELATILTGLQDNLELEHFAQQRQQALIAVLLAKPAPMAQWFAQSFFSGDYSLTQRIAMLTTLGLGARELAGVKDSTTEELIPTQSFFPSKQLPPHLHKLYAPDKAAASVAKVSSNMAREMLSPVAFQAADQLSGPNILKLRTFSSRMEVEKKRQKPVPNALAQIVADNFYFPLTGRWWLQIRASSDSLYTSTHLLPPFLQTLSLLLNASGPNTLALPQMTREYWDLLLTVRGLASKDKNILNAVLFGFLMILETNESKERLATEQGKELVETQAWVKTVFEGLGAGSEEDERVRVLAAGVVVRCQEVIEKYQRRMVGVLMDY